MRACILAAGKGSRIDKLTKTHKCLLPIGDKAILSHIIDKIPIDIEIVLALGYHGDMVQDYCNIAHPDRDFLFVNVPKFEGAGSGPGYSLSCCEAYLKDYPFYLFVSDCIITDELPTLDKNWIGIKSIQNPVEWCTVTHKNDKITKIYNKSFLGSHDAFIGVAGIKDSISFFNSFNEYRSSIHKTNDKEVEFVGAFYNLKNYDPDGIMPIKMNWFDTGTVNNYLQTKQIFDKDKSNVEYKNIAEHTYFLQQGVIKLYDSSEKARSKELREVPNHSRIISSTNHVLLYEFIPGTTLSSHKNKYIDFLKWCKINLWRLVDTKNFHIECKRIYYDKTAVRISQFLQNAYSFSKKCVFGDKYCPDIITQFNQIDWDLIINRSPIPSIYHGDLQPDNVIISNDTYRLIDCRDKFGSLINIGDMEYDLAKFYAASYVVFKYLPDMYCNIIEDNEYLFINWPTRVFGDTSAIEKFILEDTSSQLNIIKTKAALILLSMSSLHPNNGNIFYFAGRKLLMEAQNDISTKY